MLQDKDYKEAFLYYFLQMSEMFLNNFDNNKFNIPTEAKSLIDTLKDLSIIECT